MVRYWSQFPGSDFANFGYLGSIECCDSICQKRVQPAAARLWSYTVGTHPANICVTLLGY